MQLAVVQEAPFLSTLEALHCPEALVHAPLFYARDGNDPSQFEVVQAFPSLSTLESLHCPEADVQAPLSYLSCSRVMASAPAKRAANTMA